MSTTKNHSWYPEDLIHTTEYHTSPRETSTTQLGFNTRVRPKVNWNSVTSDKSPLESVTISDVIMRCLYSAIMPYKLLTSYLQVSVYKAKFLAMTGVNPLNLHHIVTQPR